MTISKKNIKGFTLMEMLMAIVIFMLISFVLVMSMRPLVESIQLYTTANGIKNQLRCAKTRALGDSQIHCGVYFDTNSTPHQIQPFLDNGDPENDGSFDKGEDQLFGSAYILPPTIYLSLGGQGNSEVIVFRGDGSTKVHGLTISVRDSNNRTKTISVLPSTGRIKILDQ